MKKYALPAAITDLLKASVFRLLASGALTMILLHPASAAAAKATGIDPAGLPSVQATNDTLSNILQVFFGIIGAFAVLMVTASGFKYITSAGDPQKPRKPRKASPMRWSAWPSPYRPRRSSHS